MKKGLDRVNVPGMRKLNNVAVLLLILAVLIPMSSANDVVVVGLDGASKDLMAECLEENDYSNIEALRKEGSFRQMDSPLPPLTPVAMSSFLTGKNPGGTGVYGFEERRPFSYETSVVDSRDLDTIFPEKVNGSSVMINVPMTYPAPEIDGVVVSGFPGSMKGRYAHPPPVKQELKKINYSVSTAGTFEDQEELRSEVFEIFQKRRDLALDYMEKYDWSFFMVMFTGDARLQHFSKTGDCQESLGDYYAGVDEFLGEVREKTDENTTVVLMSNHGFKELDKKIYLYTFLKQNGYLEPEKPGYYWHWIQDMAGDLLSTLGISEGGEVSSQGEISSEYMKEVDWENTEAYTGGFYNGQVFINLEEREPRGTVPEEEYEEVRREIIEDLEQLRDPETGEKVVENVYKKEEIYSGERMEDVPDIIVEAPGYNHIARFGFGQKFLRNPVESSSPVKEGFVISNRKISGENLKITDLTASVTAELGDPYGEGKNFFAEKSQD